MADPRIRGLNIVLFVLLSVRGVSFPDPYGGGTPWYLNTGFVAGIPAVPGCVGIDGSACRLLARRLPVGDIVRPGPTEGPLRRTLNKSAEPGH